MQDTPSQNVSPLSAEELREKIADLKRQNAHKISEKGSQSGNDHKVAQQAFLNRPFTDIDKARIRRAIEVAANGCFYEVNIFSFPADFLEDRGRRINNREPDWYLHLSGYAEKVYVAFEDFGKPHGFRLLARVISYPNGMIGEIGLFVNWES